MFKIREYFITTLLSQLYVTVGIILRCGKYLLDRTTTQKVKYKNLSFENQFKLIFHNGKNIPNNGGRIKIIQCNKKNCSWIYNYLCN